MVVGGLIGLNSGYDAVHHFLTTDETFREGRTYYIRTGGTGALDNRYTYREAVAGTDYVVGERVEDSATDFYILDRTVKPTGSDNVTITISGVTINATHDQTLTNGWSNNVSGGGLTIASRTGEVDSRTKDIADSLYLIDSDITLENIRANVKSIGGNIYVQGLGLRTEGGGGFTLIGGSLNIRDITVDIYKTVSNNAIRVYGLGVTLSYSLGATFTIQGVDTGDTNPVTGDSIYSYSVSGIGVYVSTPNGISNLDLSGLYLSYQRETNGNWGPQGNAYRTIDIRNMQFLSTEPDYIVSQVEDNAGAIVQENYSTSFGAFFMRTWSANLENLVFDGIHSGSDGGAIYLYLCTPGSATVGNYMTDPTYFKNITIRSVTNLRYTATDDTEFRDGITYYKKTGYGYFEVGEDEAFDPEVQYYTSAAFTATPHTVFLYGVDYYMIRDGKYVKAVEGTDYNIGDAVAADTYYNMTPDIANSSSASGRAIYIGGDWVNQFVRDPSDPSTYTAIVHMQGDILVDNITNIARNTTIWGGAIRSDLATVIDGYEVTTDTTPREGVTYYRRLGDRLGGVGTEGNVAFTYEAVENPDLTDGGVYYVAIASAITVTNTTAQVYWTNQSNYTLDSNYFGGVLHFRGSGLYQEKGTSISIDQSKLGFYYTDMLSNDTWWFRIVGGAMYVGTAYHMDEASLSITNTDMDLTTPNTYRRICIVGGVIQVDESAPSTNYAYGLHFTNSDFLIDNTDIYMQTVKGSSEVHGGVFNFWAGRQKVVEITGGSFVISDTLIDYYSTRTGTAEGGSRTGGLDVWGAVFGQTYNWQMQDMTVTLRGEVLLDEFGNPVFDEDGDAVYTYQFRNNALYYNREAYEIQEGPDAGTVVRRHTGFTGSGGDIMFWAGTDNRDKWVSPVITLENLYFVGADHYDINDSSVAGNDSGLSGYYGGSDISSGAAIWMDSYYQGTLNNIVVKNYIGESRTIYANAYTDYFISTSKIYSTTNVGNITVRDSVTAGSGGAAYFYGYQALNITGALVFTNTGTDSRYYTSLNADTGKYENVNYNSSISGGTAWFGSATDIYLRENASISVNDVFVNYYSSTSVRSDVRINGGALYFNRLRMAENSSIDIDNVDVNFVVLGNATGTNDGWRFGVFGGSLVVRDYLEMQSGSSINLSNVSLNLDSSHSADTTEGLYRHLEVIGGAFWSSNDVKVNNDYFGTQMDNASINISNVSMELNSRGYTKIWGGAYADTTVYSRLILTNNSRIDIDNTYISQNALSTVEVTGGAFYHSQWANVNSSLWGYVSLTDSSISISDTRYGDMNAANGTTPATFNGGAAWIYNTMTLDRSSFTVDGVRRTYTAVEEGSVFQADTDYYTRSGSGTEQDPFVYTLAKVTVGAVAGAGFYTGTTLNATTGLNGGGLRMEGSITMKNSDLAAAMTEFGTSTVGDTVAAKVDAVIAETVETAMASQEVLDEIEADVQTALGEDPALDEDTVRADVTAAKREALTALYTASLTAEQTAKYTALYSQRSALTVRNVDLAWTKRASRVANDAITGGGVYMGTLTANYADILVENIKLRAVDYSLKDLNGMNPQNWNSSINGGGMRIGHLTVQDSSFEIADIGISIDVTASETRRGEVVGGALWVADTGSNDANRYWNTFNRDVISIHDVDITVSSWKSWSRVVGKGILFEGWSENAILNSTAEFHDIHATINAPSLSYSDGSTITAWGSNTSNNLTIVGEAMTDGNGDPMLDEYGNQLYTVQFYDNTYNWYTITKDDAGNFIYTPARGGNGGEIANNYGNNSGQNNNNVFDLENIYMRGQREDAVSVTYNGVRYGYFTQDGEGNWVYTHTADQTVDTPADVEAGSEVPADTYYEAVLTDDVAFVKGTDYYTRAGSGTDEDPYVYTRANVAYGNSIAADTYYSFRLTDDAVFSGDKTYYAFANHYVGHSGDVVIRDAEGNTVFSFSTGDIAAQIDGGAISAYVADAATGTDKRLFLGTFAESGTGTGGAVYLNVYKLTALNNLVIHGYNANTNGAI